MRSITFNQDHLLLSYRHSYHAGNFADVLKHIVVIEILGYLTRKDSPFDYFDSHAGAGLYDLGAEHATRLQEYTEGIGKLNAKDWPELAGYFSILKQYNPGSDLHYYPGSPLIAMQYLRKRDRAWLFEMHPTDHDLLQRNIAADPRVRVMHEDGYPGLLALLPPLSRRGLILLDPSYEIKTDYKQVFETVNLACKKFATATYAVWYPVVERKRIDQLVSKFRNSGIKKIQRYELSVTADSRGRGMSGAGMIVVNPPWPLLEKMSRLLPRLVKALGQDEGAGFKSEVLVGE